MLECKSNNKMSMQQAILLIFSAKIFSDILYDVIIIDAILLALAGVLLLFCVKTQGLTLNSMDACIVVLCVLFTFSYFKSNNAYFDYIKIMSAFCIYFLGKYNVVTSTPLIKQMAQMFSVAMLINCIAIVSGHGVINWYGAITLNGLYYFKTDLALAIAYFTIFQMLVCPKLKPRWFIVVAFAGVLTFFTNARIYYLIFAVLLFLYYMYHQKMRFQLSIRLILSLVALGVFSIAALMIVANSAIAQELNLIAISISSPADLLSHSNLQGRNVIWGNLFADFNQESIFSQLFGTRLDYHFDSSRNGQDEHSTFVKVIITTGYVGFIALMLFCWKVYKKIQTCQDLQLVYAVLMLAALFFISGISTSVILTTPNSWLPFFFFGMLSGYKGKTRNENLCSIDCDGNKEVS